MPELAITAPAWASAAGSPPRSAARSIALLRWSGSAVRRPSRQLTASRVLKAGHRHASTRRPPPRPRRIGGRDQQPARRPCRHSPSRSAASRRSSSTTSHGRPVPPSQAANLAATDSASPRDPAPAPWRPDITRQHRRPARRGYPGQKIHRADRHNDPAAMRQAGSCRTTPASPPMPGRLPARDQRHRGAADQHGLKARHRVRPGSETLRKRRHRTRQDRPRHPGAPRSRRPVRPAGPPAGINP